MKLLNIIVKGAQTLTEYKLQRAVIAKLANRFAALFSHGDPETAWMEKGAVCVIYKDGARWKYTSDNAAIPLD